MQNPVPDAPPERSPRQDADRPCAAGSPSGAAVPGPAEATRVVEIDGPTGPEPTRYGDWERKGRCIDF